MIRKLWGVLLALCLVALAACGGSGTGTGGTPQEQAEIDPDAPIIYQNSWAASSLDPHKTRLGADGLFLNMIYDRLVHRDSLGAPIPGLAESWEMAEDGMSLTLQLREGVTFHDGEPFNADAVDANITRAKEEGSGTASLLTKVTEVQVVDDHQVILQLNAPAAELVLTLSDLPGMMISPKSFETPEKSESIATDPVGAGRYTLGEWEAGARYVLESYPDYWDPEAAPAKTFEWQVVADPQTRLNAVMSGDANIIQVSTTLVAPAEARPDLIVQAQNTLNSHTILFNRNKSHFDKVEVRQAILHAINREEIIAGALDGQAEEATQPFPQDYFAYNADLADMYPYDPDRARELLADVGLADGFSFELVVLNVPQVVREAEIIKAQLSQVDVEMAIRPIATADFTSQWMSGEGDAGMNAWAGRGDPALLLAQYFGEGGAGNATQATPEGFVEALDAANAEFDQESRGELLGEVSRLIMEQAMYLPVVFFYQGAIHSEDVVGFEPFLVGDEFRGVGATR